VMAGVVVGVGVDVDGDDVAVLLGLGGRVVLVLTGLGGRVVGVLLTLGGLVDLLGLDGVVVEVDGDVVATEDDDVAGSDDAACASTDQPRVTMAIVTTTVTGTQPRRCIGTLPLVSVGSPSDWPALQRPEAMVATGGPHRLGSLQREWILGTPFHLLSRAKVPRWAL
jgi:hypothetical protein